MPRQIVSDIHHLIELRAYLQNHLAADPDDEHVANLIYFLLQIINDLDVEGRAVIVPAQTEPQIKDKERKATMSEFQTHTDITETIKVNNQRGVAATITLLNGNLSHVLVEDFPRSQSVGFSSVVEVDRFYVLLIAVKQAILDRLAETGGGDGG